MRKINFTICYDEEKLAALKLYLSEKNMSLEKETCLQVEKLFERHVPPAVRSYLERKCAEEAPVQPVPGLRRRTE